MTTHITSTTKKHYTISTGGMHAFIVDQFSGTITFTIAHAKANVWIFGLYELRNNQQCTVNIIQHHTVPGAQSHTLIKSVLYDTSHINLSSTIRIDSNAHDTTASFAHHTLLVDDAAWVTTQPILEVIPGDISCHHSATITSLSEISTNYLAMRGLSKSQQEQLLIAGFIKDLRMQQSAITKQ